MATIFEAPASFDRDLRSANKEFKRSKDTATKWSHGSRAMPSAMLYKKLQDTEEVWDSNNKIRPGKKPSDAHGPRFHHPHNVNKAFRAGPCLSPFQRVRSKIAASEELHNVDSTSRSLLNLLPNRNTVAHAVASEDVLYSFDCKDSPGQPVGLDAYVKPTTSRQLEKMVEKEFEILDGSGNSLKGRKARMHLRKAAIVATTSHLDDSEEGVIDEDGFELV